MSCGALNGLVVIGLRLKCYLFGETRVFVFGNITALELSDQGVQLFEVFDVGDLVVAEVEWRGPGYCILGSRWSPSSSASSAPSSTAAGVFLNC